MGTLQFSFDDQGPRTNDPVGIADHQNEVLAKVTSGLVLSLHPVILLTELLFAQVVDGGEDSENVEKPGMVVEALQGSNRVGVW